MPEPTAAVAESSPAIPTLSELTPTQYQTFREKGTIPERQPAKQADAGVKEESAASTSEGEEPETAAASEAAPGTTEKKAHNRSAEARIKELLAQVKDRDAELERLKKPAEVVKETKTEPQAKVEKPGRPKMDDVDDKGQPKYATLDDFIDAVSDWKLQQFGESLEAKQQKASQEAKIAETKAAQKKDFATKVEASKAKHDDFEAVAFAVDLKIPPNTVLDSWILDSEHGTEVLYALGKDRAKLAEIVALSPIQQAQAIRDLEIGFSGSKETKPIRIVKPASEVAAQNPPPEDDVEDAVKKGDFARFKRIQDARDMAKLKSR